MNKDIVTLVVGFLSALLLFFGTVGFSLDWFNQDSINAFGAVLAALIPLAGAFYGIWKNTYVSKKAQEQAKVLEKEGLK